MRSATSREGGPPPAAEAGEARAEDGEVPGSGGTPELDGRSALSLDAAQATDEAEKQAAAAVSDAKAEAEAAQSSQVPGRGRTSGE